MYELKQRAFSLYSDKSQMKQKETPLILSLETSTRVGSIAVLRGCEVLAAKNGCEQSSHSKQLLKDIEDVLRIASVNLRQINLIAAAVGPGSFTGLRIGLATAKALAKALRIPSCGVSTLAAVAGKAQRGGLIYTILPAGRNEFFAQLFEKRETSGVIKSLSEIKTLKIEELIENCDNLHDLHWIACEETISKISDFSQQKKWSYQLLPVDLASSVGEIALKTFFAGETEKYSLIPIYVRGADIGGSKNVG